MPLASFTIESFFLFILFICAGVLGISASLLLSERVQSYYDRVKVTQQKRFRGGGEKVQRHGDTHTHTLRIVADEHAPNSGAARHKKNKVRSSLLLPPPLFVCVFGSC